MWTGPLLDPSGYGEESRNFLFALDEAGAAVAAQPIPWSHGEADLTPAERNRLQELAERPVRPGFVQIIQNLAPGFSRHPQASAAIGRTMFETDRLPVDWVKACNRMDYVWVPSEFNRQTFMDSGVAPDKLVVLPGCFDPSMFQQDGDMRRQDEGRQDQQDQQDQQDRASSCPSCNPVDRPLTSFAFLSVFDWTLHKGWDVLLRAFLRAFEGKEDVSLVLKVWSTMGYSDEQIREQAAEFVRRELDRDLLEDSRVVFLLDKLAQDDLLSLYRRTDCFVLPSRGDGWGRPFMEAMACGVPALGTNWSCNTAFMTAENSYLLDCELVPVPEAGWREIPPYKGHRWAEPSEEQLIELMRHVHDNRDEAAEVARRGREHVLTHFTRKQVAPLMLDEVARAREAKRSRGRGPPLRDLRHRPAERTPAAASTECAALIFLPGIFLPDGRFGRKTVVSNMQGERTNAFNNHCRLPIASLSGASTARQMVPTHIVSFGRPMGSVRRAVDKAGRAVDTIQ